LSSNFVSKSLAATPSYTDCRAVGGPRVIHVTSSDPNCMVGIRCSPDGTVSGPRFALGTIFDARQFPALSTLPYLSFEVVAGADQAPTVVLEGPANPAGTMSVVTLAPTPSFTDCSTLAPDRLIFVVSTDPSCLVGIRVSPDGTRSGQKVLSVNEFERDSRPFRWLAFDILQGTDKTPHVYVVALPSDVARKTPEGLWFPTGLAAGSVNGYKTELFVNDGGAPVVVSGIALDVPGGMAVDATNTTTLNAVKYSSASPRVAGATLCGLNNAAAALPAFNDNLFTGLIANPVINPGEAIYLVMAAAGSGTALPAGTHVRTLF
jgi:hypothetical protein